jgi:hypothetical protein
VISRAFVRMVATSATRDAANAQEFTDRVLGILGVEPEVSLEDGVRRVCETIRRRLAAAVTAPQ